MNRNKLTLAVNVAVEF